ncbi:MAG: hypothetical protein JAY75_08040 [Candidatus Thiodiazotropha taylori]|nr:hypothetical protein [Candidatus Thiodiazotropha taylori]MCW4225518.1 hypothetical protein [Candidatus Thiodiazotropha endolucinida]MCG7880845.1 hypothetical protein [Candidatus Thiodiazotropha taylori]MCG7887088.1 hypothetical protein [Candidatus Thiodiazotropha taylori]MCG7889062.1 hypothetical protein [Candidatus Thiodiazotropha taylori]
MKKIPKQSKRLRINRYLWNRRINQKYMPHAGYMGNGTDIHLILGVNGTGINHLTQLLSQPLPNSHFIHNPLEKFEPKLTLSTHDDRLAIPYHKELTADHPLNRIYRIYAENNLADTDYNSLLMENKKRPRALLILKETHGLLATEALLRELQCHALFYVSDPIILAEQIFSREGLNTPYLDLESEAVMESRFLKRFLSHDLRAILHAYKLIQRLSSRRQHRVQMKIFTIALIQHMFRMLAARYPELASVVDFDCIVNDPKRLQFPLVNWLGTNSLEHSERILNTATFKPDGQVSRRWTRSWPETINAFEALSAKDVSLAYQILIDHELMRDEGKRKTWDERVAV